MIPVKWSEVADWIALLTRSGAKTEALVREATEAAADGSSPEDFLLRMANYMSLGALEREC